MTSRTLSSKTYPGLIHNVLLKYEFTESTSWQQIMKVQLISYSSCTAPPMSPWPGQHQGSVKVQLKPQQRWRLLQRTPGDVNKEADDFGISLSLVSSRLEQFNKVLTENVWLQQKTKNVYGIIIILVFVSTSLTLNLHLLFFLLFSVLLSLYS